MSHSHAYLLCIAFKNGYTERKRDNYLNSELHAGCKYAYKNEVRK